MSAQTAETRTPQQEQKVGSERLTHEQLRHEMAKLAALLILLAKYNSSESDHLFKPEEPKTTEEKSSPEAEAEKAEKFDHSGEILGLLNHAFAKRREAAAIDDRFAAQYGINALRRDFYAHRAEDLPGYSEPKPFVKDAPTMADAPLGPTLPDLAFNDRIRPQGARPSDEQFAAADRANDMYKKELFKQGWTGGEATDTQAKKAGRAMQRQYHPDTGSSQADQDALKAFTSQKHAKPTTPGVPETSPRHEV